MNRQSTPGIHTDASRSAFLQASVFVIILACVAFALTRPCVAKATAVSPPFPRLAIWWPNSDTQPAADRARCDWIALQSTDAHHIAELRRLNPSIVVLGSTSARELNYNLGSYNDPSNAELRSVSTDWILTQLGSTLAGSITAASTSIPVADRSRFAAGEMVLVDHELMHVVAVGSSALTVTRGQVMPATSHASGARIASVVSHWPNSITFDLSTDCPLRDVGDGHGQETWSEWNVRRGAGVLASADWDGLLIDTLESDPHWMVTSGDVRSIDPARTNKPVTDGYAGFDAAWYQGAVAYGNALRAAVGSKILIGNGNMRDFNLNGAILEEFPYAGVSPANWKTVFIGPYAAPRASYPEWMASAVAPNLTMFQVYGAATNYQLMRFGLTSALMNDGYFSYALSSSGHARNGLYWFDEYDNAGVGRGYLGQPTGAATQLGAAWRRDYGGGIVLVNPSGAAVTVQLGGAFRKIKGTQAPKVNDGSIVSAVTIPSQDGIVLLRIQAPAFWASSAVLKYGRQTTLRVVGSLPAAAIRIEQRPAGSGSWQAVATMTTDADGAAELIRAPLVTTEYRFVFVGTGQVSNTVKVGVQPSVTLKTSRTSVRRSSSAVLSGAVVPASRIAVTLQRSVYGTWRTVKRLTASSSGRYSARLVFTRRGTIAYRVVAAADGNHLSGTSNLVRIAVR